MRERDLQHRFPALCWILEHGPACVEPGLENQAGQLEAPVSKKTLQQPWRDALRRCNAGDPKCRIMQPLEHEGVRARDAAIGRGRFNGTGRAGFLRRKSQRKQVDREPREPFTMRHMHRNEQRVDHGLQQASAQQRLRIQGTHDPWSLPVESCAQSTRGHFDDNLIEGTFEIDAVGAPAVDGSDRTGPHRDDAAILGDTRLADALEHCDRVLA